MECNLIFQSRAITMHQRGRFGFFHLSLRSAFETRRPVYIIKNFVDKLRFVGFIDLVKQHTVSFNINLFFARIDSSVPGEWKCGRGSCKPLIGGSCSPLVLRSLAIQLKPNRSCDKNRHSELKNFCLCLIKKKNPAKLAVCVSMSVLIVVHHAFAVAFMSLNILLLSIFTLSRGYFYSKYQ